MRDFTWVELLPAITGCLYLLAALGYWRQGMTGWGLAYFGYALANVGLVMAASHARGLLSP